MTRSTKMLGIAAMAALGLGSGLAGAALFSKIAAKPAAVTHEVPLAVERPAAAPVEAERADTMRSMRAWMDGERTRHVAEQAAAPAPELTPEESDRKHRADHERAVAAHATALRDSSWATASETSLASDLRAIQDLGASAQKVDCRTKTCTIELEWPTYEDALQSYSKVIHAPFQVNCAREMLLPEPPDHAQPYRTTAVLDCESLRSGQQPG